ncbi:competence/damage-inducible protein A [Acidihalobacter ferrooxydans]|uniref:Competence/damage-inducible protein A n=1 Tax=Acidihalobacter ferrooxydans TaxID=1765967 RepID=A0A1P8UEC2_9GAMM|nr:molybdopterin-binding protein [Acidihalobacter ferrooxydans]APZ42197.1 competence/damage-inducible protein A [Acidihalobacter ferrooxydans]
MNIGLVLIGDELLSGKRQDKHFAHMREVLAARGLDIAWVRIVGDERERLTRTLRETFASGDIVFSFGGIGGTPDDLTRECAAAALGRPIERHPEAVAILEERFGAHAYPLRIRMAELPAGATLIPNPINRIPGFSLGDHHFVPGFPNMAWPMAEQVLDTRYAHLFDATPPQEHRLCVDGAQESQLIPLMEAVLAEHPGLKLSSLPNTEQRNQIELGVRGRAAQARSALDQLQNGLDTLGLRWRRLD